MQLKRNESGELDPLLVPLMASAVLIVGLSIFGVWAYLGYLDFRQNTDEKIEVAVAEAKAIQAEELEAEFAEREKNPKVTYTSDASIGSIKFSYPKTWSAYVEEKAGSNKPLNAFFHPRYVPAKNTSYALRILVDEKSYEQVVSGYEKDVEKNEVEARSITVNNVEGVRLDGQIDNDYRGAIVIFPLRDKTVQIWTESDSFLVDFNAIVQNNLTFVP